MALFSILTPTTTSAFTQLLARRSVLAVARNVHTSRLVTEKASEAISKAATAAAAPQPTVVVTRKSSVRSALFGLFLGATFASVFGASYLVEEIQKANVKLLTTVDELYKETEKVRGYLKRIGELEKEIDGLRGKIATKDDLENVKQDARRLYDQSSREQLSLRSQLRDVELDVQQALKEQGKSIDL
ncbi:hypothetical protein IWQ60_000590 [Tieghemiomyces parasiticus]|uniref:Uncharacterized protein n=1 Tax=Tieghemiomyces parasiticus TaxID=78921 RepID=A0A9W8AEI9_9FUNG|nr:hypothetical protein IWQ60_000590 [Tieghemiomyces parasiticus]